MLRNKEFFKFVIVFLIISVITVSLGFAISTYSGLLSILSCICFGAAFLVFTKARYKSISKISDQIDVVLHNDDHVYIADVDEGELSILQSEISKMTLRIREQNDALKKEKKHLADSMADIAHQLRTPLTSVNLILSLLENNSDADERKTLIRETKELFVQMDWLLTSLLKLSRIDAGIVQFKNQEVDVEKLIDSACKPLLIQMELHNVILKKDVPQNIKIKGDYSWLSESLQNIIKNCMESADDNGKVEITATYNPLFTEINIHDNGKGFAKEDLNHVFDRFYRGKNSGATGYGIGLALSKMIITRQGGFIKAKNHKEGGALFSVRFPK